MTISRSRIFIFFGGGVFTTIKRLKTSVYFVMVEHTFQTRIIMFFEGVGVDKLTIRSAINFDI